MPCIRDKSTVDAIAREYCTNGRNEEQALLSVDYSKSYARSGLGHRIYSNIRLIKAIAKIDAKSAKKYEHTREIAINKLYVDYNNLETLALAGNIQAIQVRTAIIRELNACTGLHSQTITTEDKQQRELTESEAREAQRLANIMLSKDIA